jgi:hypothetical protein
LIDFEIGCPPPVAGGGRGIGACGVETKGTGGDSGVDEKLVAEAKPKDARISESEMHLSAVESLFNK